ncbi:hypothetical protein DVT68_13285 [Dyella solisilvae]|uniref:Uncharacterized protein n=2 Tax=Dyella solisilvae TaxID=1920168 RepID=A0A370K5Y5_9GAMM|nr:hypothetical protein DVT68_13285 [Dyella solisilvae]
MAFLCALGCAGCSGADSSQPSKEAFTLVCDAAYSSGAHASFTFLVDPPNQRVDKYPAKITPNAIHFYMEHPGATVSVDRDSGAMVAESTANVIGFRGVCHKQDKTKH